MEYKFRNYCENGKLIKAINIYKKNQNINIHANNESAFQWSCKNSNLEVAKWLIKLIEYNKYKLLVYYNITSNNLLQNLIKLKLLRHIKIKKNKHHNKLNNFFIKN